MAAKIGVLASHQKLNEVPNRRVKRCVAALLVRRNMAESIHPGLIRMREIKDGWGGIRGIDALPKQPIYIPFGLETSIDAKIGVIAQFPVLSGQVRYRPIADQRSNPAY